MSSLFFLMRQRKLISCFRHKTNNKQYLVLRSLLPLARVPENSSRPHTSADISFCNIAFNYGHTPRDLTPKTGGSVSDNTLYIRKELCSDQHFTATSNYSPKKRYCVAPVKESFRPSLITRLKSTTSIRKGTFFGFIFPTLHIINYFLTRFFQCRVQLIHFVLSLQFVNFITFQRKAGASEIFFQQFSNYIKPYVYIQGRLNCVCFVQWFSAF